MAIPGYWRNETSGVLRPVVESYIRGEVLDVEGIMIMRAYLRQWANAPHFRGVDELRASVDDIVDMETLRAWLDRAGDAGIDPL